jgi:hypothetical protein
LNRSITARGVRASGRLYFVGAVHDTSYHREPEAMPPDRRTFIKALGSVAAVSQVRAQSSGRLQPFGRVDRLRLPVCPIPLHLRSNQGSPRMPVCSGLPISSSGRPNRKRHGPA